MSYYLRSSRFHTALGMVGPSGVAPPTQVNLFSPELIAETQRTSEILDDRAMAAKRGVAVPGPLTAAQLPSALLLKVKTLGSENPLKAIALVGATAAIGYFAWRSFK